MEQVTLVQKNGKAATRIVETGKVYMTRPQALAAAVKLLGSVKVETASVYDVVSNVATTTVRRAAKG